MNPVFKSWRTAAAGIAAFVVALGIALVAMWDNDPSTNPDWNAVVVAGMMMIGLLTARDNNVTSEDAGAQTSPETVAELRREGKDVIV